MTEADLDEVLAIERASFTSPWSRRAFLHELRDNRVAALWVVRAAGAPRAGAEPGAGDPAGPGPVLGYLCVWVILDELHVTNLAVHPGARGHGVGAFLLGTVLAQCRRTGSRHVTLEVRAANAAARRLYARFGFREVGVRRGYYFDTGEDALVLEADLAAPGAAPAAGPGGVPEGAAGPAPPRPAGNHSRGPGVP
jgi:ribosomal-protein-alanine N-acetyltransferase